MGRRLRDNITSHYFEAANRLASKRAERSLPMWRATMMSSFGVQF